jgi:hypothetical protein
MFVPASVCMQLFTKWGYVSIYRINIQVVFFFLNPTLYVRFEITTAVTVKDHYPTDISEGRTVKGRYLFGF